MDYENHSKVLEFLELAQSSEEDNRDQVKEARVFVSKKPRAQWEDFWWTASSGKPRYTFDMTTPVLKAISGELTQADFNIQVDPAGGDATKDLAKTYDGLVRNIENVSNATAIFNMSSKAVITGGMDGCEIVQEYVSADSFDQDLMIKPIHNYVDRVWFDHAAEERDMSDARHVFKLTSVAKDVYEADYPDGSGMSIGVSSTNTVTSSKDVVICGQVYYLRKTTRELALMNNGEVLEINDDFKKIVDEKAAQGITVKRTRSRPQVRVYIRKFDAEGWLNEAQETAFGMLPIVPQYANFEVFENEIWYSGEVTALMDSQRVYNYAKSREIEEGALAMRQKLMLTAEQAVGSEDQIATLNNSPDADFQYTHVDGQPAPYLIGGSQINPGLQLLGESMKSQMQASSGQFAAAQGANPGLQSGVAINALQDKSDTSTTEYFTAREVFQARIGRVLVDAIPRVYDAQRVVRIMAEDGSYDMVPLHEEIFDEQSGQMVTLNDLSQGIYDVTCAAGPAFKNRQDQVVDTITAIGQVDPSFIQLGSDILASNMTGPGSDQLAERKRRQLLTQGVIPEEQQTDEEKQYLAQQAQQQQEPDAMMVAAMAEQGKAEAAMQDVQVKTALAQAKLQEQELKIQQAQHKLEVEQFKAQMDQQKFEHQRQMDSIAAQKTMAETEGQNLANAVTVEELQTMPFEKLVSLRQQMQVGNERQVN